MRGGERSLSCFVSHRSPLPARVCHPGTLQSSPIDPDSLTLPERVSGTGRAALALAPRLDQIQLLSSRCDEHNSVSTSALREEGSSFALSGTSCTLLPRVSDPVILRIQRVPGDRRHVKCRSLPGSGQDCTERFLKHYLKGDINLVIRSPKNLRRMGGAAGAAPAPRTERPTG